MRRVSLTALLGALSVAISAGVNAGPIDNLQPGQWYEVPNSHLEGVLPNPLPPGSPSAIMDAWSGGAYDTRRDRLIVWGGGHGDYSGNEVYAFDINSLTWSRIWGPTDPSIIPTLPCSFSADAYADGNPVSRHTYDGLEYLPNQDVFLAHGGSGWCLGGMRYDTWHFNVGTLTWTETTEAPDHTTAPPQSAYDPVTGHAFIRTYNRLYEYDPDSHSWTLRSTTDGGSCYEAACSYDPTRKYFVLTGQNGETRYYNLSNTGLATLQPAPTSGDKTMEGVQGPGFEYDPVIDRMVAWKGGTDVYVLNLDTWVWTRITPSAGNTVVPTASPSAGTWGRFRYVPSKNAFVTVNRIDGNVYFYKLSTGGGAPSDTTPPSAPGSLRAR
jgi:hypothetical protein